MIIFKLSLKPFYRLSKSFIILTTLAILLSAIFIGFERPAHALSANVPLPEDSLPKESDKVKESQEGEACTPFEQMSLDAYMKRVQSRIYKRWKSIKTRTPISVTVSYKIKADGTLTSVDIKDPSSNKLLNERALDAIKKAAPFESIPEFQCIESAMEDGQIELGISFSSQTKKAFKKNPRMLRNNRLVIIKTDKTKPIQAQWLKAFKSQIKDQWDYVLPKSTLPVILQCVIDSTGNIKSLKVKKSSGNKKKDKMAQKSLEYAAPFSLLPEDFTEKSVELELRLF